VFTGLAISNRRSRLSRPACVFNLVNVLLMLTKNRKRLIDKGLEIGIFHFGGGILKRSDSFIMIADHDFGVGRIEFFPRQLL